MITTITAFTQDPDDVEGAVSSLLDQLKVKPLKKHSVGIVSCFADFIGSGTWALLAEKLPFSLVGTTTLGASGPDGQGDVILILTVLTSDDVEFVTGLAVPVTGEDDAPFRAAYDKIAQTRQDRPSLMLSFAPLLIGVSADFFVESWDAITGGVPNFGALSVDHNPDYRESQTLYDGRAFRDGYAFVLCYGKLEPRFFIGGIPEEKAFREKGVITASRGNQLKEVNGISVADYLVSLGLEKDEKGVIQGINSYPFILDYNDGTQPVIRVMFAITPDGSAVCGGKMPEGSVLTVGALDAKEIQETTGKVLRQALDGREDRSLLIFSCVGRYFAQGFNTTGEMDLARQILDKTPFHMAYCGTEICPVYGKDNSLTNRSHNDTMVICVL
ncbi:MAG: FIST C-terminal domain-containing protein [Spirochaetales bacterium]|jgi:hypothetical protein|nr:FIST C-terminal domain-containing protein [Spirochaetales bacterium]